MEKDRFNIKKQWLIPRPTSENANKPSFLKVSQVKFFNEYFPTGHKIYDTLYYPDIATFNEQGIATGIHYLNRVSMPIQAMSIDIILAHLLGNKTYLVDSTLKDNDSLPDYREFWENKDLDTARYELIKSVLALGDGALLFYRGDDGLEWKLLSMFNGDKFHMEYDKYDKPSLFYRYYDDFCDTYDDEEVHTYSNVDGDWKHIKSTSHGFKDMPIVYKKRESGAFWSPVQANIDNAEKMLSRVSEDNRSKFKSLYHLKTDDPDSIQSVTAGLSDMLISDTDSDFKLVSSAEISTQFEFEYQTQMELIFNTLGIVFPKHKSSGDQPVGTMKMTFYATERVVMSLMMEFDTPVDEMNAIAKQGFVASNPKHTENIIGGNIRASIRLFAPQDEESKNDSVAKMFKDGIISAETAAEECSLAANNEASRKEKERKENIARERERTDLRLPFIED